MHYTVPFGHFPVTPWMGDQPIARPVPTQKSTTQTNSDTHPRLERDSNPERQISSGSKSYAP